MYPDIDESRGYHAELRRIVDRHAGAAADYRARRRVLDLCRRAAAAIDDRYCRDKLRQIEDFAAELLSHSEHHRWDRDAIPGEQFLKQQILDALELLGSRLYALQARRRTSSRSSLRLESLHT